MKWAKIRWFLAACSLLLSVKMMVKALTVEGMGMADSIGAAFPLLVSLGSFLTTVFLIAPETAFRIAEWCSRPFTAILFPSEHFNKPPLTYKLARRYRDEKRWDDAARQYRKIIRYYPKEADAYLELLHVAGQMGDHKMEQQYAALFRRRFK
jgi:hypothetical protein